MTVAVVVLSVLAGGVRPVWAQSLGDLARQTEERKTVKGAVKVYTSKDLGNVPPASASAPAGASQSAPAPAGAPSGGAAGQASPTGQTGQTPAADANKGVPKDQAYWAGRMKDLSTQLSRDQTYASALQVQVNSLTNDFINRDDPAQRSVIEQNRQTALSELGRLQKEIEKGKKAVADLEDEARRAGAPPGWLR